MPKLPSAPMSGDSNDEVPVSQSGTRDWVRQVDFYNAEGKFIPGTILLFEDGAVGIYKESNSAKDYDIIYMLRQSGRIAAQGMPLYNYEIEPIGRLSHTCFDHLVKSDKWERDMMVFHLLKYKDHIHIPHIDEDKNITRASGETFSQWAVQKLPADQVDSASKNEKPQLSRGRRMTIEFGPNQRWEAVYWGKDELGYVVAHNTHDRWALMHLDLDKFKDSTTFHDIVDNNTLRKMERDFAQA